MKRAACAVAAVLFSLPAFCAEPRGWSFEGGVDAVSRYVWRGIPLGEGPALQPAAVVSRGGWSASAWGNYVANNEPGRGHFNEVELGLARELEIGRLTVRPELAFYSYPRRTDIKDTLESTLGLSYPVGPLFFSTNQTIDVLKYDGSYFGDLGVGLRGASDGWEGLALLSAGWASAEFNKTYLDLRKAGWNALGLECSAMRSFGRFSLQPHLEWTRLLDGDLRRRAGDPTIFRGGLRAGFSF